VNEHPNRCPQGAASFVVQSRLAEFVAARRHDGFRVAGCVETIVDADSSGCGDRFLKDLSSGRRYKLAQELGSGSIACKLDASGVVEACADAIAAIRGGCDLVVLAKFGKLEARRSGLIDAFAAAVECNVPILTSVAPKFSNEWAAYAGDLSTFLTPSRDALSGWWRSQSSLPAILARATG
jgi:hypothetical protein